VAARKEVTMEGEVGIEGGVAEGEGGGAEGGVRDLKKVIRFGIVGALSDVC
jgi:hypothetical protein